MSAELECRLRGSAEFGQLLFVAGAAAANFNSATHRAIACRDVDALGQEWCGSLPKIKAEIVGAIIGTVHALAAAPTSDVRAPIAAALRSLVAAGRTPDPPRPVSAERRHWW